MDPERWRRVEDLFHRALDLPAAERDRFLNEQCTSDPELHREVDRWIAADAHAPAHIAATVTDALRVFQSGLSPGVRIGPYDVLALQGEGGMGAVYRARRADDVFQKEVAIKVVRRGFDSADLVRRFKRERQILARLEHPGIARVLDGGSTDEGLPYLVMEFVSGQNLLEYAKDHRLDAAARVALFAQVCDAVAYAHDNQIVHRDLKPGNILVDASGRPRLLDFGIAKLVGGESASANDASITAGDFAILTPRYASPEHVRGEPITVTSDVYSLGVILYELLSGCAAHRLPDDSPAAIVKAVCEDAIPLPSTAAAEAAATGREVPIDSHVLRGHLDRIVMMALERNPAQRYASAQALASDLRRYLDQQPIAARPTSRIAALTFLRRHRRAAAVLALAAVIAVVSAVGIDRVSSRRARATSGKVMLAVLPLENLTGNADQEFFVDGLHEEIISRLGRLRPDRLGVIARTSMLQYKDTRMSIADIGRELGAQYVLEGSVRQSGERVRVTAQLIQVSDQAHVWVESFDRELRDLFSVQGEIGAHVADSLELEVLSDALAAAQPHGQLDPATFARYLRGRYYWQRRWLEYPANLQRAVDHFQAVVAAAPGFADGFASLAQAYESLAIYSPHPDERRTLHERGRAALSNAMALDPQLASVPAALAMVHFQDWNWAGMEQALREALRRDPNAADTHQYLAQLLAYTGRHDEADRETRLAQELDPLSPSLHKLAFWVHVTAGQLDKAQRTVRTLAELSPDDPTHVYFAAHLLALRGDCPGARRELARRAPLPGGSGVTDEEYAAAYVTGRCGDPEVVAREARRYEQRSPNYAQTLAAMYAAAGDRVNTLRWLEESFRRREPLLASISVDPSWELVRSEPRFRAMLDSMGLSPTK